MHENDVQVYGNAARFFTLHDRDLAAELLEKAQTLDPANPAWAQRLGHLYSLGLSRKSDEERAAAAARSLQQFEKALAAADDEARRAMLQTTAKAAFEAGDLDKARSYALELVSEADESSWNFGNAIHHGNLISRIRRQPRILTGFSRSCGDRIFVGAGPRACPGPRERPRPVPSAFTGRFDERGSLAFPSR